MKKIWLTSFLILYFVAHSQAVDYKYSLTFGIYTWHYAKGDYTEGVDNRLIALEYDNWYVADFNNSHGRETQFLGYGWHTKKLVAPQHEKFWVRGNLYTGVLIGYGKDHPQPYVSRIAYIVTWPAILLRPSVRMEIKAGIPIPINFSI